jgi:hypothetical protein
MKPVRLAGALAATLVLATSLPADRHVVVVSRADPEYLQRRLGPDGAERPQSYVVLPGRHYPGFTVDRTMERTTIRDIVDLLAPELTRRGFVPGASAATADLLLVVHWGTTIPRVGLRELTAQPTEQVNHDRHFADTLRRFDVPVELPGSFDEIPANVRPPLEDGNRLDEALERIDRLSADLATQGRGNDSVALLGYAEALHQLRQETWSSETERALHHDLNSERYFVIVRAYELRGGAAESRRHRPVWTMHLNIRAPGNNFRTALARLSVAAGRFAGQDSGTVATVRVPDRERTGTVTLGDLIILGEAK